MMPLRPRLSSRYALVWIPLMFLMWFGEAQATGASFSFGFDSYGGGRGALAIGDFDVDGDLDFATGASGSLGNGVYWYVNDGGHPASFSVQPMATGVGSATTALETANISGSILRDEFVSATGSSILIWEYSGGVLGSRSLGSASSVSDIAPDANGVYLALGTDLGYAPATGTGVLLGGQAAPAETYRSVAHSSSAPSLVAAGISGIRSCVSRSSCPTIIASGVDAYDVEIVDLDSDGDMDILAALNDRLVWYEFDFPTFPTPGFSPARDIAPFNSASLWSDVEAVDFDMDGDLDVVATDAYDASGFPPPFFDGFVAWFENDGQTDPTFTRTNLVSFQASNPEGSPQAVDTGDLDGDGDVDLAFASSASVLPNGGFIAVQENEFTDWRVDGSGAGSLREGVGTAVAGGVDINGDGFPDQLVANRCGSSAVTCDSRVGLYLGTASGVEASPAWIAVAQDEDELFGYAVAFVGDVNADGYQDVGISAPRHAITTCLSSGQAVGEAYLWYGGAPDGGNPTGLGPNGTRSNADVILRTPSSTNTLWHGTCSGSPSLPCGSDSYCASQGAGVCACRAPITDAFGASLVAAGDRDGDGVDDLLIGDPGYFSAFCFPDTRNNWGEAYLFSGGTGGPTLSDTFEPSTSAYCGGCPCGSVRFGRYAAAGDIDGDGLSDFAIGLPSEFETHIYLDHNSGGTGSGPSQVLFQGSRGVTIADVDADGFDDVITADIDSARAFVGSASGVVSDSGWSHSGAGIEGVSAVGDLNGDCHVEIAVPSSSESLSLYYGESSSAGLGADPLSIMPRWKVAAMAGDVAGDGFDDLLVGNETGGIYDLDGGAAAIYQGANDSAGPADCDGDGFDRANDCDDSDPTVYPGGTEICDGLDNDCNGLVDDGPDSDADGVNNVCDNCPSIPNGPLSGSCVIGDPGLLLSSCVTAAECGGAWGFCSDAQNDQDLDGVGDACDPDTLPEPSLGLMLVIGGLFLAVLLGEPQRRKAF